MKLGAGFAVFWILLWIYNTRGCQKVEGKEMEPTLQTQKTKLVTTTTTSERRRSSWKSAAAMIDITRIVP